MISFAFGAPNIFGSERAKEINDSAHMKVHFFNVTDNSDPTSRDTAEITYPGRYIYILPRSGRRSPIGNTVQLLRGCRHFCLSSVMGSRVSGNIMPGCREKFNDSYKSAVIAPCKLCARPSDEDDDSPKPKVERPAPRVTWPFPLCLSAGA